MVIEKRATFSPLPGVDRLRPGQAPPAGGIDNLYLAGDYTRTGWPATMEGAVRSGYLAAEAVLAGAGTGAGRVIDPTIPSAGPPVAVAGPAARPGVTPVMGGPGLARGRIARLAAE